MATRQLEVHFEKKKDDLRSRIHKHFSELQDIIKNVELKALAELERQSEDEMDQLKKSISEIKEIKKNVQNDMRSIDGLIGYDDRSKIICMDLIKKISKDKNDYHSSIDIPNQRTSITLYNNAFDRIKNLVKESCVFSRSAISEEEKSKLMKSLFSIDHLWYCIR